MKLSTKLTIAICSTILVAGATGIGLGVSLKQKEKQVGFYEYREMGTPKVIYFNSGKSQPDDDWDFPIKIYPYDNGEYWLNDNGIKELRDYLKKSLYHGQEIASFNGLIFGNTNLLKKSTRGIFYPHSREIFVNVEQWKNSHASIGSRIRGSSDTITHEYGHFINASYLTSSKEKDSWKGDGKDIPVKNDNNNDAKNWNKEFMEKFYKTLNYNSNNITSKGKTSKYSPVTSKFSLNDLFWNANGNRNKKSDGDYRFFPVNERAISPNEWSDPFISKYREEYMNYRYSFNEIVTRQLGQLMHVMYREVDPQDKFGEDVRFDNSVLFNGFIGDLTTSIQVIQNKIHKEKFKLIGLDKDGNISINKDGFYKDYMFGFNNDENGKLVSRAEEIYKAFTTAMGYGKLISNVQMINELHLNYKLRVNTQLFQRDAGEKIKPDKFRLTGFAPSDISGVYYGDINNLQKDKLSRFPSQKNRTSLWNFNRKEYTLANDVDTKISKQSEISKNGQKWIPYVAKIVPSSTTKEFSWWKDKNHNGNLDPKELISTKELLTVNNKMDESNIMNEFLPLSTYRSILDETEGFPKVMYDRNKKEIIITKY